jgi:hypothetical protein
MQHYMESLHSTSHPYEKVPYLSNLSLESRGALEREQFTVTTINIKDLGSEMVVPILTWEGIERNVIDLRELFGEPVMDVRVSTPDQPDDENPEQKSFLSQSKFHLGDYTDAEFRERFFNAPEFFNQRGVGQITSSELSQGINQRLLGRLHAFYHADTSVGRATNLDQPAPELQLTSREHMIWMVGNLRLDDLPVTSAQRRVARITAILHDWGKIVMSRNGQHPEIGAAMARSILLLLHQQNPSLYPMELVNDVCWSINMHHLLERVFKPVKEESLSKISDDSEINQTLLTYNQADPNTMSAHLLKNSVQKSEEWYLYQAAKTNIKASNNEHVISVEQYHSFMEYLQTLAYYEDIPESQHALGELTELLRNPDEKNIGLMLAMVRVIEADLVASDRPPSETAFRLNQLQLVLQGILATAEA